jgi:flagellar biosynthesis/type III secretory pathway protein FliH
MVKEARIPCLIEQGCGGILLDRQMLSTIPDDAKLNDAMTLAEKIFEEGQQEGWQKGRHEGWQKGRQEGQQEGRRIALLDLLQLRFGDLSPQASQKVSAIPEAQLGEALRSAVSAVSIPGFLATLS